LGRGQFGTVYKFTDSTKVFSGKSLHKSLVPGSPDISVGQLTEFVKEIEYNSIAFASYSHSNIEQFEAALQLAPDGPPTLLSEYCIDNLDTFIKRMEGKWAIHKQLELCLDMARGLQYLHSIGVVHHNLHGRNILISQDERAKVADYVCPQVISTTITTADDDVAYLPPEVIEDRSHYTEQSDIYSMGVLLLQVAIQKVPAPTEKTEYEKILKRKEELTIVKGHPLWSTILQCFSTIRIARPTSDKLCLAIAAAKELPQSVMSSSLHQIVSVVSVHTVTTYLTGDKMPFQTLL